MSDLDALPPDQRAVLQLLLAQGRTYEGIAALLRMDDAAVRTRALAACDALAPVGPEGPDAERRAEIADFVLGQQHGVLAETTRTTLAAEPESRAWARDLAGALQPIARERLPEVPASEPEPPAAEVGSAVALDDTTIEEPPAALPPLAPLPPRPPRAEREVSRTGLLLLAGLGAVVAVVVVLLLNAGGDNGSPSTSATTTPPTTTQSTGTTGSPAPVQVNLLPVKQDDKALAIATILTQGNSSAMALVGQDLPPTTSKEFYVVWLYNSPADAVFLGYTSPVGKNGRLSGTTRLPAKAANYGQLVVSREGAKRPKRPTKIVLKGSFKLS